MNSALIVDKMKSLGFPLDSVRVVDGVPQLVWLAEATEQQQQLGQQYLDGLDLNSLEAEATKDKAKELVPADPLAVKLAAALRLANDAEAETRTVVNLILAHLGLPITPLRVLTYQEAEGLTDLYIDQG